MNEIHQLLISNMKLARKRLGISQQKLAACCDLSTSFIGDVEIGKKFPSANSLLKIANALGLKPYQLFLDEGNQEAFKKFETLNEVEKELKKKIIGDIEQIIRKHQKNGKKTLSTNRI